MDSGDGEDSEADSDEEENGAGFTDENQSWLQPKKKLMEEGSDDSDEEVGKWHQEIKLLRL